MFNQKILFKRSTRWKERTVFTITTTPDDEFTRLVSMSTNKGFRTAKGAGFHVLNPAHYFMNIHFITSLR